jgi:peptidyl-prolyl cis-trans isomerase SurA
MRNMTSRMIVHRDESGTPGSPLETHVGERIAPLYPERFPSGIKPGETLLPKLLVCAIVLVVSVCGITKSRGELFSDKIVAVVNGEVILDSEVKKQKQPIVRSISALPLGVIPPGKWPTEKEILDELIIIHLLEQEAAKKGIKIDEKGLDASIEALRKRNNLDPDQFAIFLMGNGLTPAEYRKIMKRHSLLTRLISGEVSRKVALSEEDAIQYFKKHKDTVEEEYNKLVESMRPPQAPKQEKAPEIPTHEELFLGGKLRLRQITLKLPQNAQKREKERVIEKAKHIYQEAMTGADFAQLAKKYSQDPNGPNGGDLGLMNYKDMVPGFQNLVQRMKQGDITPPISTPGGVLIFYLAEAKDRTTKKVPIPEKIRKKLEEQMKEAQAKRSGQRTENGKNPSQEQNTEEVDAKDKPKLPPGLLTASEEKDYLKLRKKVIDMVRYEKIQARMKEWIEELKKNSVIEVKI